MYPGSGHLEYDRMHHSVKDGGQPKNDVRQDRDELLPDVLCDDLVHIDASNVQNLCDLRMHVLLNDHVHVVQLNELDNRVLASHCVG